MEIGKPQRTYTADYGVPIEILGEAETPIARAVRPVRRDLGRRRHAAVLSA